MRIMKARVPWKPLESPKAASIKRACSATIGRPCGPSPSTMCGFIYVPPSRVSRPLSPALPACTLSAQDTACRSVG